jgi:hypothetical protein
MCRGVTAHNVSMLECKRGGRAVLLSMWLYDDARECASDSVFSALEVKFREFAPDMVMCVLRCYVCVSQAIALKKSC